MAQRALKEAPELVFSHFTDKGRANPQAGKSGSHIGGRATGGFRETRSFG